MLHPLHRLSTVGWGVQVPRTCPCEQGAMRALWTVGMGCICTYTDVCDQARLRVKGPMWHSPPGFPILHPYMCWGYCMKPGNPPAATEVLPECQRHPISLEQWGSALPPPAPCTQETQIQQTPFWSRMAKLCYFHPSKGTSRGWG